MAGDEVILEKENALAIATLNRPEVRNALNAAMVEGIEAALNEVERDRRMRVLIFTGSGEKSFLSGSDIRELSERTPLSGIEISLKRKPVFKGA